MSFMEPQITEKTLWLEVESTKHGTWWVQASLIGDWPGDHRLIDVELPGGFVAPDILDSIIAFTEIPDVDDVDHIKLIRGYGARLSAPGYLDCTEWCVFKTLKGARDYLKEQEDDDV